MIYLLFVAIFVLSLFLITSYIKVREKTNVMKSDIEERFVRSTKEGRLYIKTSDFFKQKKVKETIHTLLKSDIIKEIDKRQSEKKEKLKKRKYALESLTTTINIRILYSH